MRILIPMSALLVGAAIAASAQEPGRVGQVDPGRFVIVGSHRMYLRCLGPIGDQPTIIFESGAGGSTTDWVLVQEALAGAGSCSYDRAGAGKSDKGPAPRTLSQEAFELHALLAAAKIRSPYVLVGQSLGGLLVRLYAEHFPSDVVGMVLVDPTHESSVLGSLRYGGMVRLREKASGIGVPAPRLTGPVDIADPANTDYLAEEMAMIHRARQAKPKSLGAMPLVVLGAGRRPAPPPGIAAEVWTSLRDERDDQLRGLTDLSSNSAFALDAASGHDLEIDNPKLVARAIKAVLASATTGAHLAF
jgi:pimeloyl-ACP methyl ester carboxylesterase